VGTDVGSGVGSAQHAVQSARTVESAKATLSFKLQLLQNDARNNGCILLSGAALVKQERRAYNARIVPELPEVETVARGLHAALAGRTITEVKVLWKRSVASPDPAAFARRLVGQTVANVGRRGKWVVMSLNGGDTLLIHLRMSGRLVMEDEACLDARHLRALFLLDDGRRLSFVDQRKFGRLHLTDNPDQVLGTLGPEPLSDELTAERLSEMLKQRRGRIKPLLLNQRFLAGLGNIYANEMLWRARIHPLRPADTLTPAEAQRLHGSIRSVLTAAIASGGTTLDDDTYRQADGRPGEFLGKLVVYGREGRPCPRCGQAIERIKVSQRSTYFCPRCQPPQGKKLKVQGIDSEGNSL
jgi:formamidopyrimidine-DNA glycosylase